MNKFFSIRNFVVIGVVLAISLVSTFAASASGSCQMSYPATRAWDGSGDSVTLVSGGPISYSWTGTFPIAGNQVWGSGSGTLNNGDSFSISYPGMPWGPVDQYGAHEVHVVVHTGAGCDGNWDRWYHNQPETPEPPTSTPQPPTETPEPPTSTPEPTNTPVPPQGTPEPPKVQGHQPEWHACDAKIEDIPTDQLQEWTARCQPAAEAEEVVVAQVVETPAPVCTDCGNEARFELLDNAVVFGGLTDSDNRGTFYTRGQALPTSEAISLVFENQGLKVYRWVDETPDAEGEEYPCSAEPQIEQFDLVDGVILYRVLPQNSRWDLQTVFENIDGASLDEGQMIAAWYEFSRTSDANFGFRPVGTYTPGMEDQVWQQLGRVFGIRIEAQVAHDTEPVFDYTALQIAAAAIHEYTLKGIEAVVASVSQQGATRGQSLVVSAKLDAGSVTVAQISAPAVAEMSFVFVLPLALMVGAGGFAINRRRKGSSS